MSTYAYPHTDAAEAAALEWLKAIDSGEFDQAWENSSTLLQVPLSSHMLARTISAARRDFGVVESRRRVRAIRQTSMLVRLPAIMRCLRSRRVLKISR